MAQKHQEKKKVWVAPELHRLRAGAAENGFLGARDGCTDDCNTAQS